MSKTSARTSLIAAVAAALALSGSALALQAPVSAAPARADVVRHAAAKATLDKVVAAFSTKRSARTAPRTTPLPRTDVTVLLRELKTFEGALTPSERQTASTYLAKPTVGESCTGTVIVSAHFCVHYTTNILSADKATPEQAQLTSDTFEYVYTKEVLGLGYRTPIDDGDGLLDVYLQNLGNQGIYGYCTTDNQTSTSSAYCAVDNDFSQAEFGAPPLNSLRVTAAHEFFHAIQFAYDADDSSWFLEGTAVWMEDIVYPTINDYLQYLPLSQVVKPQQSADFAGGLERYGTVIFWKFLSERFNDDNIIRQVWNAAAVSSGTRNGITAVGAVLAARGYTFATEFARYGIWNTLAPGTYGDRRLWPAPGAWASGTLSRSAKDTKSLSVRLNHLAHAPLVLRVGSGLPTRTRLNVIVDGPNRSHGTRATVQIRLRSGGVKLFAISLNSLGNASRLYSFNPQYVKSAIVILTNGSVGYNSQLFRVRARVVY